MNYLSLHYLECILLLHFLHPLHPSNHFFNLIVYFFIRLIRNFLYLHFLFQYAHSSFLLIFLLILILFIKYFHFHFLFKIIRNLLQLNLHFRHRPLQNIHYQIHHHLLFFHRFNYRINFLCFDSKHFLILGLRKFNFKMNPPLMHFQINGHHQLFNLLINRQIHLF